MVLDCGRDLEFIPNTIPELLLNSGTILESRIIDDLTQYCLLVPGNQPITLCWLLDMALRMVWITGWSRTHGETAGETVVTSKLLVVPASAKLEM